MPGPMSLPSGSLPSASEQIPSWSHRQEIRHSNCPDKTRCTGQRCVLHSGKTYARPRPATQKTRERIPVTDRLPGYHPRKRTRR